MTQSKNKLLLFFDHEDSHKTCLLMFLKLNEENFAQAQRFANQFDMKLPRQWGVEWTEPEVTAQPDYIQVEYQSNAGEELPYELLHGLFRAGLRGAAIESHFPDSDTTMQHFFVRGSMVTSKSLYKRVDRAAEIVAGQFSKPEDEAEQPELDKPMSLRRILMEREQAQAEQADTFDETESIQAIAPEPDAEALADLDAETDELLRKSLIKQAIVKGSIQGLPAGVIAALVLDDWWLWLGLGVLIAIGLSLFYVKRNLDEFENEDFSIELDDGFSEISQTD
ncbi:hypothetical protein GCM10008090_00950 [Arenicella chitinivorans]|uniref:Uncharacterized protein n=1 Tax=Arenicella chitinivorans TaxID=1329800 RepID=A0A918RF85_9GAMM|nr:hypothetical protein [Arenicella chitinivorans]GGZ96523.1 hypothetical protein GCM10008090_00950 [Arenicella chitinivorans]